MPNPASIEIDVTLSLFSIFFGRLLFWAAGSIFYAFRLKPGFIFCSTIQKHLRKGDKISFLKKKTQFQFDDKH